MLHDFTLLSSLELMQTLNTQQVDKQKLQSMLDWQASDANHHVLTWLDEAFPKSLLNTDEPPMLLYAKGNLPSLKFEHSDIWQSSCLSKWLKQCVPIC